MNRCKGFLKSGERCSYQAKRKCGDYCGIHKQQSSPESSHPEVNQSDVYKAMIVATGVGLIELIEKAKEYLPDFIEVIRYVGSYFPTSTIPVDPREYTHKPMKLSTSDLIKSFDEHLRDEESSDDDKESYYDGVLSYLLDLQNALCNSRTTLGESRLTDLTQLIKEMEKLLRENGALSNCERGESIDREFGRRRYLPPMP